MLLSKRMARTACDGLALAAGPHAGAQAGSSGPQAPKRAASPMLVAGRACIAQASGGSLQAGQAQLHGGPHALAGRQAAGQALYNLALPGAVAGARLPPLGYSYVRSGLEQKMGT